MGNKDNFNKIILKLRFANVLINKDIVTSAMLVWVPIPWLNSVLAMWASKMLRRYLLG